MKDKFIGSITAIGILLILCSGILSDITNFFLWLFMLQYLQPEVSIAGEIIARILTFFVSYGLVGVIFNAIGLFNSKAMSIVYFIISALAGFAIAYVIWTIEQHIVIICIVLAIILVLVILYFVIKSLIKKKKKKIANSRVDLEDE